MIDINYLKNTKHFFLFAGPCAIESEELALETAKKISEITTKLNIPFIYKSSFEKANRTSVNSFHGVGIELGLQILKKVKQQYNVPIITDVHECWQVDRIIEFNKEFHVIDILQIPSLLAKQTPLLLKCGESGLIVNIKKPQFGNHTTMKHACDKVKSTGNNNIVLMERGSLMGYNSLVYDIRNIIFMKKDNPDVLIGCDVTHMCQIPNIDSYSHGNRELIKYYAKCSIATNCVDGLFMEVHPDPPSAKCDSTNQLYLSDLEQLLSDLIKLNNVSKQLH